jgi:hypothetical protein
MLDHPVPDIGQDGTSGGHQDENPDEPGRFTFFTTPFC